MEDQSPAKQGVFDASRFKNQRQRMDAAKATLQGLLTPNSSTSADVVSIFEDLLSTLLGPLRQEPPGASQAAEGALTLLGFTLAERRKLEIVGESSPDLDGNRVPGDRGLGDWLCKELLAPMNIPATKGPFQSSSFRGGYASPQVRNNGLRRFVVWYSAPDRSFDELVALAERLGQEFLARGVELPALPKIAASRLTFTNFRLFRERLLSQGSGGAFEQYLLAGLLQQEIAMMGTGLRVQTKNVGANDAATRSGGDIEVRHGQVLLRAYEVTANHWSSKLTQMDSSAAAGLDEVTLVASGVAGADSAEIVATLGIKADQLGIDAAVVDLDGLLDVVSSRISRHARSEAILFLYQCLARWHRRQPELITRLVSTLHVLNLVVEGQFIPLMTSHEVDVEESLVRVRELLDGLGALDQPGIADGLRELAAGLDNRNDDLGQSTQELSQ